MYSVYQHWDPLKVCIVGRSYPPEFYSFIKNSKVRAVMERIAAETEEDYQKLIKLLESFNVEVLRPTLTDDINDYFNGSRYEPPPMTPRDYSAMIGNNFYFGGILGEANSFKDFKYNKNLYWLKYDSYKHILEKISQEGNEVQIGRGINTANITRVGKDLYHGTEFNLTTDQLRTTLSYRVKTFTSYRNHIINTNGHSDGSFCPVVPGLIVSLVDISNYRRTFPDWEVIYLPNQSWEKVRPFLNLKEKNKGKWWVPGEELNDDFTSFVENWIGHWVGYVEETVFDVNMLVIDEKNVVCNNYNKEVFDAFERRGITPHIINFRHRYFWDGGLHCITSDIHREGTIKDFFPNRNEEIIDSKYKTIEQKIKFRESLKKK